MIDESKKANWQLRPGHKFTRHLTLAERSTTAMKSLFIFYVFSPTYDSNMETQYISGFVIVFLTNISHILYNGCCKLSAFAVTVRAAGSQSLLRGGVWGVIPKS